MKGTRRARVGAKRLRRAMALPEVLLWQVLRTQPGGHRFRRQAPTGDYVLDFYCAPVRLAIEGDGEAHSRGDRPVRDAGLEQRGVAVLRVRAADVLRDLDAVVRLILAEVGARFPPPPPA